MIIYNRSFLNWKIFKHGMLAALFFISMCYSAHAQDNLVKQVITKTAAEFGWVPGECFDYHHNSETFNHCITFRPNGNGAELMIPVPHCQRHKDLFSDEYLFLTVEKYPSESAAKIRMEQWIRESASIDNVRIIKFHGHQAIDNSGGMWGSVIADAGIFWQAGSFAISVTGPPKCVSYMSVSEALYANAVKYGLIAGQGGGVASIQDSDGDGVADDIDKCPNTKPGVTVDLDGCAIVKEMSLTLSTDKKAYSAGETVVIKGNVSNEKGELAGASVVIDIKGTKLNATSDASGNYHYNFSLPPDIAQGIYTVTATAIKPGRPNAKKSTRFAVGEIGIQLEENTVTRKPFNSVTADGGSSLRISISLPGCSEVKVNKPVVGKLKGDAIHPLGRVTLDPTGMAEITYYPPDYLSNNQLVKHVDVHKSNSKTWFAEVPLTFTYKDASGKAGKIESKILINRPPVMLVHGFLGGPATWGKMSTTLRGEKFDTYLGDYGATGQSIEGLALILKNDIRKQKIDYARANIKLAKVDIVGHSMGGLISRYYTHGLANYPGDVRKLIMVGTPNHGVSWTKKIIGKLASEWYATHRIPAEQLRARSPFMKTLNSGEKTGAHYRSDIQYGNIYGYPDDWVVSAASAYLNGVAHVSEFDVKHSPDISGVPAVAITEYRKTWNQVNKWLTSDIYKPQLKGSHTDVYKYQGDVYLDGGKLTSSPVPFDSWGSLRTGKNATATVHLTLNRRLWGMISLGPESEIFLGYRSPQLTEVRLWKGTAIFRSGKDGHFTVPVDIKRSQNGEWWKVSPQAVITGRGTEFIVRAGKNIRVHCLEGELIVATPSSTKKGTILSPHESVAVTGENIAAITPVSKDDFWWSTENDNFPGNSSNATSGLFVHNATIKDWDQRHETFSFSQGKIVSKEGSGDFFIADRGNNSIIHVFDSPGIIDMGVVSLDSISKAPESGYQEVARPIEGHAYVMRSQKKYGKIRIQRITRPPRRAVTEYEIAWAYQPDGTKGFGGAPAPTSSSPTMPTIAPSADAYVYAYNYRNWNRSNRGKYDQLRSGWHPTGGESRAYIKFDLSNVDPSKVNKAILKLYHFQTSGGDHVDLGIYRVTGPWKEGTGTYHSGLTENTASPGEISWVQQPPIDSHPVTSFNPGRGLGDWIEVDVTPLVKQWLAGTPNFGLVIKPVGSPASNTPASVYHFASRERKADLDNPKGESKAPTLILSAGSGGSNAINPPITAGSLLSGTYRVEQGRYKSTWKLRVANGQISGTSEWSCCPGHRIDAVRGTLSGNSVVIERDCSGQEWNGSCRQTYKGTIKGDRITGSCSGTGLTAGDTWVLYLNGGTPPQPPAKTPSKFQNALAKPCGSDKAFIRSLYQSILERDLDVSTAPGHGAAHLRDLQNGTSRWRIIWNFFNSPEYKKKQKNHHDFIRDVYQAVFGREPQETEINDWPEGDRNDILRKFFNSDEYLKIKGNCKDRPLPQSIADVTGSWKWFTNAKVTIHSDGRVIGDNGGKGFLTVNHKNGKSEYLIRWDNGNYIDKLYLINKDTLKGQNQNGTSVWAERILPPSTINIPYVWVVNSNHSVFRWNGQGWDTINRKATDIGVGSNGTVWITGEDKTFYGHSISRWMDNVNAFVKVPGEAIRIDVNHYGIPWAINTVGDIYRWINRQWERIPGKATDIGVGPRGDIFIIGTKKIGSNYGIYHWNGSNWDQYSGAAVRIDVDAAGKPWVVNSAGEIYRWSGMSWERLPGLAHDIAVGPSTAWVIGTDNVSGGHGIYRWNTQKNDWDKIPGGAVAISVGNPPNNYKVNK